MVNVHHRYAVVGGRSVFYREAGDRARPAVVLLHGAPASSFMFRGLIPLLAGDYHVVAPDLLGFGLSDAPAVEEFDYTFDTLTDSVAALLDELGLDRYAIYVQDYGAPVGWRLALRHPERIAAIVSQTGNAYDAGFAGEAWQPFWAYAADPNPETAKPLLAGLSLERIRWQYMHGVPDPTLVDPDAWIHDHAQVNRPGNPAVQLKLYGEYPSNVALYPAVHEYFRSSQVPLLAVWGRNDEIFGPAGAEAFRADLPAAEVHLLEGGHFLLESELESVAAFMTDFLGRTLTEINR